MDSSPYSYTDEYWIKPKKRCFFLFAFSKITIKKGPHLFGLQFPCAIKIFIWFRYDLTYSIKSNGDLRVFDVDLIWAVRRVVQNKTWYINKKKQIYHCNKLNQISIYEYIIWIHAIGSFFLPFRFANARVMSLHGFFSTW